MLIRKETQTGQGAKKPAPRTAEESQASRTPPSDEERLEILLSRYEKNLELEAFYIKKKNTAALLEILPAQGSMIELMTGILRTLRVSGDQAQALEKRLAAADAKRAENMRAFNEAVDAVRTELEEMNQARLRLKQARTLAKSNYADPEPSRLENWA
jgi:hypothetical protein